MGVHNSYTILTRETFVALVLVIVVIVTLGEKKGSVQRKRENERTNRSKKKKEKKNKNSFTDRIAQPTLERFFVKHRQRRTIFKIFRIEKRFEIYNYS